MSSTPRLGLPMLTPGQVQKELFHNEALQSLDMLVMPAVEEPPRPSPPASPEPGACYIVAASPTDAWVGKADHLAEFTTGGWRFAAPADGMTVYVRATETRAAYRSGSWEIGVVRGSSLAVDGEQVVGARAGAIPSPAGGAAIDTEARSAIDQILAAMRQHGLIAS